MITGTKNELDRLANENECSEHHQPLTVAWIAANNAYYLRCGAGHLATGISKKTDTRDLIKRGELLPDAQMDAFLPREDLGSHQLLLPEQLQLIIKYARRYGLDPYRGHVVLMYGQPYIGIDGYMWYARKHQIPFNHWPRPMTSEQRKEYDISDDDRAWICTGTVNGIELLMPGIGIVQAKELTETSKNNTNQLRYPVVANHPQLLAQKRAEWQWFRRAFPIGEETETTTPPAIIPVDRSESLPPESQQGAIEANQDLFQ